MDDLSAILRHCPHCKGFDIIISDKYCPVADRLRYESFVPESMHVKFERTFRAECNCGVCGPYSNTIRGAAQAWNMMLEGTEAARAVLAAQRT